MKTFAYPEMYREIAADNLGVLFDYGVNFCHYGVDQLFELFLDSGCAEQFANGSPRVLIGMSGVELCHDILSKTIKQPHTAAYPAAVQRSPEYWTGWIISQYQWYSCKAFEEIYACVKMSELLALYYPLHEAHEFKTFKMLDKKLLSCGQTLYNTINQDDEIVALTPPPSYVKRGLSDPTQRER